MPQGDLSVTDYCVCIKTLANTLGDVGQTVSDESLILTILKGLNPKFDNMATVVPLLTPFQSFMQVQSMLLLQELKNNKLTIGADLPATAFFANAAPHPGGQTSWRPSGTNGSGNGGGQKNKKWKGKGSKGSSTDGQSGSAPTPSWPTVFNPWTRAFQLWPTEGNGSNNSSVAGVLGPLPGIPLALALFAALVPQ